MIRETLDPGSKCVFMSVRPTDFYYMHRTTTGGGLLSSNKGAASYPNNWVRVTRAGNVFTAYTSNNGTTWTSVAAASITMATNVYIGLAVSSGSTAQTSTATLKNVTATP